MRNEAFALLCILCMVIAANITMMFLTITIEDKHWPCTISVIEDGKPVCRQYTRKEMK